MSWITIRDCGKVICENEEKRAGEGKNKTREFLKESLCEFAKVSTRIFDTTGDWAFSYKEKQLSSIFLPAFYNLGYGAFQEVPTRRTKGKDASSHGWLDYWLQKNEKWVFLIEVKHDWQHLKGKLTDTALKKIKSSIQQLEQISEDEKFALSTFKTTYKISLVVLPVYRTFAPSKPTIDIDREYRTSAEELNECIKRVRQEIADSDIDISWIGSWLIPNRMQLAFKPKYTKDNLQSFSGVIVMAKVVD